MLAERLAGLPSAWIFGSLYTTKGESVTLRAALAQLEASETIEDSPRVWCGKWPDVLVVQVLRWRLGACGCRWVKDHRMIAFDAELEGHYDPQGCCLLFWPRNPWTLYRMCSPCPRPVAQVQRHCRVTM